MADCSSCAERGNCSSQNPDGTCPSAPQKVAPAPGVAIKHVVAIASGKGGVGKSLVTSLLAVQFARLGLKVGILDADLTGPSIPKTFGVEDQTAGVSEEKRLLPVRSAGGIKLLSINVLIEDRSAPVVWRGPIIAQVVRQFWEEADWGELDVLLVDMPPGTGDVPLTVYQSLPIDGLVMVATPQDLVTLIVQKATRMAELMKVPVFGLIENMSYFTCPSCGEKHYFFGKGKLKDAADRLRVPLLAEVPLDPSINRLVDAGAIEQIPAPILQEAAATIWQELLQKETADQGDAERPQD